MLSLLYNVVYTSMYHVIDYKYTFVFTTSNLAINSKRIHIIYDEEYKSGIMFSQDNTSLSPTQ